MAGAELRHLPHEAQPGRTHGRLDLLGAVSRDRDDGVGLQLCSGVQNMLQ